MTLGDVIYSVNRLEEGERQYVAFSFNKPLVPLWQGHIVLKSFNGELMVIRQPDESLAVVWASNFPNGVRANYHELLDGPIPRVPILPLPVGQAREAALILLRRTDAEQSEEPYTAQLYRCGNDWHYTEEIDRVLDASTELHLYRGESGKVLAQVTRSLMERAGMLCEHTDNS